MKLQKEIDDMNEAKIAKLPVKAKTEIKALQEKLVSWTSVHHRLTQLTILVVYPLYAPVL